MSAAKFLKSVGLGHTLVPIAGTLARNPSGAKKKDFTPPKDYVNAAKNKTLEEVYEHTPLYGMVAGIENDQGRSIIVIDADSKPARDKLLTLLKQNKLEQYPFIWVSKYDTIDNESHYGIKVLFWNTNFSKQHFPTRHINQDIKIDILNEGLVFCPGDKNHCVEPWTWDGNSQLVEIPPQIELWLKNEKEKLTATKEARKKEELLSTEQMEGFHADDLDTFVASGELSMDLRNVWFNPPEYRVKKAKNGPRLKCVSEIPEGFGNEFLKRICGIMTFDTSVNKALARRVVEKVNNVWAEKGLGGKPDMETTIAVPLIDNASHWNFNPDWKEKKASGVKFKDKNSEEWEIITDRQAYTYIAVCRTLRTYVVFPTFASAMAHAVNRGYGALKPAMAVSCRDFNIVSELHQKFGENSDGDFNLFRQNPYLDCIQNPEKYAMGRSVPEELLILLENNIDGRQNIDKFLAYVTTYLRTGKKPALNFYLIGAQGSGKSAICELFSAIMGHENCLTIPDTRNFLEPYDNKLRNKYIVVLEEIGDQIKGDGNMSNAFLGKIKGYTTIEVAQLREMHKTALIPYRAKWLFLATGNVTHLPLPADDRRSVVFKSEKHLEDCDGFIEWKESKKGEIGNRAATDYFIQEKLRSEQALLDICYYLATNYPSNVEGSAWTRAWYTAAKKEMSQGEVLIENEIGELIQAGKLAELEAMAKLAGMPELIVYRRSQLNLLEEELVLLCHAHGSSKRKEAIKAQFESQFTGKRWRSQTGPTDERVTQYLYPLDRFATTADITEIKAKAEHILESKKKEPNEAGFTPTDDAVRAPKGSIFDR